VLASPSQLYSHCRQPLNKKVMVFYKCCFNSWNINHLIPRESVASHFSLIEADGVAGASEGAIAKAGRD
jgi:hypothetical protein